MLDWLSGIVGYDASNISLGHWLKVDREGEVVLESEAWERVRGSYDDTIGVRRSVCTAEMQQVSRELGFLCSPQSLVISGNPIKFLQGHNIWGPSPEYMVGILQQTVRALPPELRPSDADSDELPALHRSRLDVTVMIDLDTHQTVHEWLQHAAQETRSRHGRAMQHGSTVYWGQGSRRWTLKAYCKLCELREHPDRVSVPLGSEVYDWLERMLRVELTLKRPELQKRGTITDDAVFEYMRKIEVGLMKSKNVAQVELPRRARDIFLLWLEGHDVRSGIHRATFWRHRKLIQEATGCDISLDPCGQSESVQAVFDANLFDVSVLRGRRVHEPPTSLQCKLFSDETYHRFAGSK